MPKPDPKKGMPPKKAKKPLKRTPLKKKYGKGTTITAKDMLEVLQSLPKSNPNQVEEIRLLPEKLPLFDEKIQSKSELRKQGK